MNNLRKIAQEVVDEWGMEGSVCAATMRGLLAVLAEPQPETITALEYNLVVGQRDWAFKQLQAQRQPLTEAELEVVLGSYARATSTKSPAPSSAPTVLER